MPEKEYSSDFVYFTTYELPERLERNGDETLKLLKATERIEQLPERTYTTTNRKNMN